MAGRLLYALHPFGAVLRVGGMGFAVLAPAVPAPGTRAPPQQRRALLGGVSRRFPVAWRALPAVLPSGRTLPFGWHGGFRGAGWHGHVMHLLGLVMGAVDLVIAFGPWRAMRAAPASGGDPAAAGAAAAAAVAGRIRRLVRIDLALGPATVAVAAWGRFGG